MGDRPAASRASRSGFESTVRLTAHASHEGGETRSPEGSLQDQVAPREALEALQRDFREHFGRDPEPEDPVFFDPSAEEPRPLDDEGEALLTRMSEMAMRRAGIDPSVIYAWHKTGLVVTERNQHMLSADDWQDWLDAIFEYEGEAICLHLQEAHGRDPEAAAVEAGEIFADHGDRICPYCGQHLQYPETAWD